MAGLEGARLGAYELSERVGSGGMAEVYRAKQLTAFGREVAVKVIRRGFSEDPRFRQRFLREAQAIAKLSHPHILPLIEFGEEREVLYLVMPYFSGGTLRSLMERMNGPLPLKDAVEILGQLCDAVQYAHEQGIVHRDIKPQNVLIQRGKHLLLADFGIARDTSDERLTMTGAGVGTVEYMAPEQAAGNSNARSDVYSLGVVFYQMLCGQVPFGGNTPMQVLMKQAKEPPPPIRRLNPALPPTVDRLFGLVLAKDPNQRFQSPAEFLHAAEKLLHAPAMHQGAEFETRAAPQPGADFETRAAPPPERSIPPRAAPLSPAPAVSEYPDRVGDSARPAGSGADFPPAASARRSAPDFPPAAGRGGASAANQTYEPQEPAPRRSGARDDFANNPQTVGWGGKPYIAPPARPSAEPYENEGTFATERPAARRPSLGTPAASGRAGMRPAGGTPTARSSGAPPKGGKRWLLGLAVVFVILALGVGGIAISKFQANKLAGNPPTGNGPAPKPSYAFLRNYQVFASIQSADPEQITQIPDVGKPNPEISGFTVTDFLASPLLFSPDGRYLAFLLVVVKAPADGFFSGQLYILDLMSKTVITPNDLNSTDPLYSYGGDNALAWQDAHTLLIAGDQKNPALLAYDIETNKIAPAFAQPANTMVGSVIVRGHGIFYSTLLPKQGTANTYTLVLHRYDLGGKSDQMLFTLGEETVPEAPIPNPDGYAPFDISSDGAHILWRGAQPGTSAQGIWYGKVDGSGATELFQGATLVPDSGYLQFDAAPLISPDGKKALVPGNATVYTVNLDGSQLETHTGFTGQGAWLPDSSKITIAEDVGGASQPGPFQAFLCPLSSEQCSLFQDNATSLYWG